MFIFMHILYSTLNWFYIRYVGFFRFIKNSNSVWLFFHSASFLSTRTYIYIYTSNKYWLKIIKSLKSVCQATSSSSWGYFVFLKVNQHNVWPIWLTMILRQVRIYLTVTFLILPLCVHKMCHSYVSSSI
jgi:hypothetical protein